MALPEGGFSFSFPLRATNAERKENIASEKQWLRVKPRGGSDERRRKGITRALLYIPVGSIMFLGIP